MLKIKNFLKYAKCLNCNKEFLLFNTYKVNSKEYVCHDCSTQKSYYAKNEAKKGKDTQMTFSFEFETGERNNELFELLKYGFIGCFDGSISGTEWKSPIYSNRKTFHAICRKLDKFAKYINNGCGTHLHVGTEYKHIMEDYEVELFSPILEYMRNNKEKTRKFWGRYFNHYCSGYFEEDRYNTFNTRSSVETLEFRLLKFKNSKQYIRASDFCIDTTKYINYHIAKGNFDTNKAKKIGKIILKKYMEVTENV